MYFNQIVLTVYPNLNFNIQNIVLQNFNLKFYKSQIPKLLKLKLRFLLREKDREESSRSVEKNGKEDPWSRKVREKCARGERAKENREKWTGHSIRVLTTFSLTEFSSWRKAGASESGSSCNRECNCKRKFFGLSKKRREKCVTRLQRILRPLIVERLCKIEKSSYMQFIIECWRIVRCKEGGWRGWKNECIVSVLVSSSLLRLLAYWQETDDEARLGVFSFALWEFMSFAEWNRRVRIPSCIMNAIP